MNNYDELWETESRNRQHYITSSIELSHSTAPFNYATFEKGIGITNITQNRAQAYWPLVLSDYCIEEHLNNGLVALVDNQLSDAPVEKNADFLILQIVSSAGTAAIINQLRQSLSLELAEIGYASIKEPGVMMSQFFSVPASKVGSLSAIDLPENIVIVDISNSSRPISSEMLKGNTYTALLRTKEPLDGGSLGLKIDILAKYGVLNYFPTKRFGRRHTSHLLGKLLLAGDYEAAVNDFLCQVSPTEELLLTRLREVASKSYPNYEKLDKIFSVLPVTFANELAVIRYLQGHQADYAGAILQIKGLAKQWLFAYGAYIFNSHLSDVSSSKGVINERFPWTFSPDTSDKMVYRHYFERDNIYNGFEVDFIKELIPSRKQMLPGRMFPKDMIFRVVGGQTALSFFLDANQSAETVMANLFNITDMKPVPEWVDASPSDAKQMLGKGKLSDVVQRLSHPHA